MIFRDLRYTFASSLVQRGWMLKEVQAALGHETITMTVRYSHLAPDHLRAAVAALDDVVLPAPKSPSPPDFSSRPVAVDEVSPKSL